MKKYMPAGTNVTPAKTPLGRLLRRRRLKLDLRQTQVAKACGMAQNQYSRLEVGGQKNLEPIQVRRLSRVLLCSAKEIAAKLPIKRTQKPRTKLGKLIRAKREKLGLSLEDFAERVNMSVQEAKTLELKRRRLNSKHILPLSETLKLKLIMLLPFGPYKESSADLGIYIRERRVTLQMTQNELAKKCNVTRAEISVIELGLQKPGPTLTLKLAVHLKVQPRTLIIKRRGRDADTLGSFLAVRRFELGMTQRKLAQKIGRNQSIVSSWERDALVPNEHDLKNLNLVLKCRIPKKFRKEETNNAEMSDSSD